MSPPTFWEARDQPEPGSFFPRSIWGGEMKSPGNKVVRLSVYGLGYADLETGRECQMSTGGSAE